MIHNAYINSNIKYPILKQPFNIRLKPLSKLSYIQIFSMPTKIKDRDITAMFNGLLTLLKEKVSQEQNQKYLQLKLKYARLEYLYNKLKYNIRNS